MFSVSSSITDFPVFSTLEMFFRRLKEAGVDGVEVVVGPKSRFRFGHLERLSEKYSLPITSLHQPAWSGLGIYFDEHFLRHMERLGIKTIVYHPLTFTRMGSTRMMFYFERLALIQKRFGIRVCVENMKDENAYKMLYWRGKTVEQHIHEIYEMSKQYDLSLTFDTSHAKFIDPSKEAVFRDIFPRIGNIHLSSFHARQEHLPLNIGNFDTKSFLQYLSKNHYDGLLTLEVFYPKMMTMHTYDFEAIKASVEMVKNI